MSLVQLTPAGPYLGLVTQLTRRRRATKLHEGSIGPVPKFEEMGVDPPTLSTVLHAAKMPQPHA